MFQGKALRIKRALFNAMMKDESISKETKRQYTHNENLRSGKQLEGFVCDVFREIEGVLDVVSVPTGCVADTVMKIDVGLVLAGDEDHVHCLQVKSTQEQADQHLALGSVSYKGRVFEVPGVVYLGTSKSRWEVVTSLVEGLGLPLKKELVDALNLAQRAGWDRVAGDLSVVSRVVPPAVITRLNKLGACTTAQGKVRFIRQG